MSGVVSVSQQTITIFNLTLAGGATAVYTYGATSGGSFTGSTCAPADGVTAPTAGSYTFSSQEKSTSNTTSTGGLAAALTSSPIITVS